MEKVLLILTTLLVSCSVFELTEEQQNDIVDYDEYSELVKVKSYEVETKEVEESSEISSAEPGINNKETTRPTTNLPTNKTVPLTKVKTIKKSSALKLKSIKSQARIKKSEVGKVVKKSIKASDLEKEKTEIKHLPLIEDGDGFIGRRPGTDPFNPGEKVVLDLKYFKMKAGKLIISTKPYIEVNGKKSYHFEVSIHSSKIFSMFYKLDNIAHSYVDFLTFRPYSHTVHLKESAQVKEARSFFDWEKLEANYWENRIAKDGKKSSKKLNWNIKDYSQNVISALFYFRAFTFTLGKTIEFYVADNKTNITFKGKLLRKEVINTSIGKIKTIVMKPEFVVDGSFKPVGDIFFWLTDDNKKQIVRIQSKIKIGSIFAEVSELSTGL
ncbi:MAG: DUF3108 domain-containing protein [Bdellovibrionaceae bacterium]|nr:DUF3108 domain-containing protein [Pseudobdellovibrionaceae bacterium]